MNDNLDDVQVLALSQPVWSALDSLARSLHVQEGRFQETLDAIVRRAVKAVDVAQYAGVILMVGGKLEPQSTFGEPPHVLDMVQFELAEGPCITAAQDQVVVTVEDTSSDSRWTEVGQCAVSLGVASMLCLPLYVDERSLGALTLFSSAKDAFTEQHVQLGRLFATLAALALGDAARTEQLRVALDGRDLIGQAKGILMERLKITADEAFARLTASSQSRNKKLTTVARHLVETGELPRDP